MSKQNDVGTSARVLQAIVELTNCHRQASRSAISRVTGLKMSQVDDCVKRLRDDGKIALVFQGVFEPVATWPEDRPISITVLPSGLVKLEIGEFLAELTPSEARVLGLQLSGNAMELVRMRNERELLGDLVRLQQEAKQTRAWKEDITRQVAKLLGKQRGLFDGDPEPTPA